MVGAAAWPRLYHVEVHELSQRLLKHIRRQNLLAAGDRVAVAVTGGADSVALLRLFSELRGELGITISVVHFNHKLREPDSDEDEAFVVALAQGLGRWPVTECRLGRQLQDRQCGIPGRAGVSDEQPEKQSMACLG